VSAPAGPHATAADGNDFSVRRRGFLKALAGALSAAIALLLGLPALRALFVAPEAAEAPWSRVGAVGDLPSGSAVEMTFETLDTDAYLRTATLRSVWVANAAGRIDVYSPVCPHLGCRFLWNGSTSRFECPCHASVFALDGRVLSGPAPRPLDTLPHKVEDGTLFVRWTNYRAGSVEKTPV
jgi:menaquinol-cytochrome c reductase iron-sulfur subunit